MEKRSEWFFFKLSLAARYPSHTFLRPGTNVAGSPLPCAWFPGILDDDFVQWCKVVGAKVRNWLCTVVIQKRKRTGVHECRSLFYATKWSAMFAIWGYSSPGSASVYFRLSFFMYKASLSFLSRWAWALSRTDSVSNLISCGCSWSCTCCAIADITVSPRWTASRSFALTLSTHSVSPTHSSPQVLHFTR